MCAAAGQESGKFDHNQQPTRPEKNTKMNARGGDRHRSLYKFKGLATADIMLAYQAETKILDQALGGDRSDYRRARYSMDRLGDLESALWESHNAETRASIDYKTERLQRAQDTERAVLGRDFNQKEERLRASCTQQAERLRQEQDMCMKTKLSQAQQSQIRGQYHVRHILAVKTSCHSATTSPPLQGSKTPTTEEDLNKRERQQKVEATTQEAAKQNIRSKQQVQQEGEEPDVFRSNATPPQPTPQPPQPPTCVSNRLLSRNRDIVKLRRELVKHLAMAHEDSGRNSQEVTQIMRLLDDLESRALIESESPACSSLGNLETLLRHRASRAADVQKDKHDRLLRTLERARIEALRVLAARHRGKLSRLIELLRDEDREKKQNLRGQLALAKGYVTRIWREHNRYISGGSPLQSRSTSSPLLGSQAVGAAAVYGQGHGGAVMGGGLSSRSGDRREDTTHVAATLADASVDSEGQDVVETEGKGRDVRASKYGQQQPPQSQQKRDTKHYNQLGNEDNRNSKDESRVVTRAGERAGIWGYTSIKGEDIVTNEKLADDLQKSLSVPCSSRGQIKVSTVDSVQDVVVDVGGIAARASGVEHRENDEIGDTGSDCARNNPAEKATTEDHSKTMNCLSNSDTALDSRDASGTRPGTDRAGSTPSASPTSERAAAVCEANQLPYSLATTVIAADATPRSRNSSRSCSPGFRGRKRSGAAIFPHHRNVVSGYREPPPTNISGEQCRISAVARDIDVLSEEETEALAALGRCAPKDLHRLLEFVTSSTGVWGGWVGRGHTGGGLGGDGGRVWDDGLVQHAADKLATKMLAEEEVTRQKFGLSYPHEEYMLTRQEARRRQQQPNQMDGRRISNTTTPSGRTGPTSN